MSGTGGFGFGVDLRVVVVGSVGFGGFDGFDDVRVGFGRFDVLGLRVGFALDVVVVAVLVGTAVVVSGAAAARCRQASPVDCWATTVAVPAPTPPSSIASSATITGLLCVR
ncbi:MAG: hypothetical protein ACRDQF_21315 [Thermocrispum sp.]